MHIYRLKLGALIAGLASSALHGATLSGVPMQGGMLMPMAAYHAADGQMHVMMPTDIPQLTPLLVSNPSDNFDPADPWFDTLDPSRQGAAFSRRYGFVMDSMSDPLPVGTQMWIRKLVGPPDLKFHRYSGSDPKAFDPIFGTEGTTNALAWSGMMFHPVVTAPPGTNAYSATFELYLVDTNSIQELTNSTSGPLVFSWTSMPDGRPCLSFGQNATQPMAVVWSPSTATNWVVEYSDSITATAWVTVTNLSTVGNNQPCVLADPTARRQFFRMRRIP